MLYRYLSCHPVTRQQLAFSLNFSDPQWSEIVGGNGSFTGTVAIPDDENAIAMLKAALEPDESAIYVRASDGSYPWGGVVKEAVWSRPKGVVKVTAVEWRGWFFETVLGPMLDMSGDISYAWNNVDQLTIAEGLATLTASGGAAQGKPVVDIVSGTSGKNRDLNFMGLKFNKPGDLIDTMARRDGGFEWGIAIGEDNEDGLPRLQFRTYYPQKGSFVAGLTLSSTEAGSNFEYGDIAKSSADRRTRCWATGAGQPPDQVFAQDTDPSLPQGYALLRESVANYNSVIDRNTLAAHARAERSFYNPKTNQVSVTHYANRISPEAYRAGDRVRFILRDRWYDMDLPAARVVEKKTYGKTGTVASVIDLSDSVMPQVDSGGVV